MYAGEEDLLAYFYLNFNEETHQHMIGPQEGDYNALMIEEGGRRMGRLLQVRIVPGEEAG